MKNQWENKVHVEGYVFNHSLSNLVAKKTGTPFIMGDINIATNDDATNIVTVHFSYVTETYAKSGKPNATHAVLQSLIDGAATYETAGTDAIKIRVDGDMEINDFYTRDGELASPKRVRGSFVHVMNKNDEIADRPATFSMDVVLSNYALREVENDEDYGELKGYAFNFRNDALPFTVTVRDKGGMNYFDNADISSNNPLVTKIWGDIVSNIIKKEITTESAFGTPQVDITTRTIRAWDVTGTSVEPMEWDDESTITKAELKKALADREVMLAEEKKRHEEYLASRAGAAKNGGNAFSAPFDGGKVTSTSPKAKAVVEEDDEDFAF